MHHQFGAGKAEYSGVFLLKTCNAASGIGVVEGSEAEANLCAV